MDHWDIPKSCLLTQDTPTRPLSERLPLLRLCFQKMAHLVIQLEPSLGLEGLEWRREIQNFHLQKKTFSLHSLDHPLAAITTLTLLHITRRKSLQ